MNRRLLICLLSTTFLLGTHVGQSHAQDSKSKKRFVEWMFVDWIDLIKHVDPETFAIAGASVGVVGLSSFADESMQESVRDISNSFTTSYLRNSNRLGDPIVLPVTSIVFGLSLLSDNHRFQNASFTSMESIIYAGVIWTSLKVFIGRERPLEGNGAFNFSFFDQDHNALPSGHTATAFAMITPFVQYIDHPAGNLLYIFPVSTALARQHLDKHWLSDTIAGGLIGYFVGSRLSRLHQNPRKTITNVGMSSIQGNLVPSLRIDF